MGLGFLNTWFYDSHRFFEKCAEKTKTICGCFKLVPGRFVMSNKQTIYSQLNHLAHEHQIFDIFPLVKSYDSFKPLEIFDRWGSLVFQGPGLPGWDGMELKGRTSHEGVYTYKARVKLVEGDWVELTGDVTLLR